jgi:hypothetical protein
LFSLSIYHSHHKSRGIGLQSAANYRDQDIIRQVPLLQLLKDALEPYRGLPPETYIIGLGTQPVTAPWYHRHWAEFWRKHEQAHPITRTYTRVRNGKQYTYHQTDWVADVCAHQFHHEYERARLMRLPCRLVGHANQKMIHEVYLRLKASDNAAKLINEHLKL